MTIKIPSYIEKAYLEKESITYSWGRRNDFDREDTRFENKIGALCSRAILASTIAYSEWVVCFLSHHTDAKVFFNFLDACWASVVDRRYLYHISIDNKNSILHKLHPNTPDIKSVSIEEERRSSIRGPLWSIVEFLSEAADSTSHWDVSNVEAAGIANLAIKILGKNKARVFKKWRRDVWEKFMTFPTKKQLGPYRYIPAYSSSAIGMPVPKEAFDLDSGFDFSDEKSIELVNQFLGKLDYEANPFLASPELMKELGYEGVPYSYDGVVYDGTIPPEPE